MGHEPTNQPHDLPPALDYPAVVVSSQDAKEVGSRTCWQPSLSYGLEINLWPWPYIAAFSLTLDCDGPFGAHGGSQTAERKVVPYMSDLMQSKGLQASFLIVGKLAEQRPDIVQRLVKNGQDIGGHGYIHTRPDGVSEKEQREDVRQTIEGIRSAGGPKIQGWRCPMGTLDTTTYNVLASEGIGWVSNRFLPIQGQLPFNPTIENRVYELVEMPFEATHTDMEMYVRRNISPQQAELVWINHVLEARRYGQHFVLLNHPINLEPDPQRMEVLGTLVDKILAMGDVWVASCGQVARRWNLHKGVRLRLLGMENRKNQLKIRYMVENPNAEAANGFAVKLTLPNTISTIEGKGEDWRVPRGLGHRNVALIRLPAVEAHGCIEDEVHVKVAAET